MNRFGLAAERSGAANPKSRSTLWFGKSSTPQVLFMFFIYFFYFLPDLNTTPQILFKTIGATLANTSHPKSKSQRSFSFKDDLFGVDFFTSFSS